MNNSTRHKLTALRGAPGAGFDVRVYGTTGRQFVPSLRSKLLAARKLLGDVPLARLEVILIGDRSMSQLHEQFMQISGPTDVLTFPLEFASSLDRKHGLASHGEVYVCVSEARRRAVELGMHVSHELLLYALHGMLHLCGFDDRTDRQFNRMHRMEDTILRRLGVGPVFAPAADAATRKGRRT